MLIEPYVCSRLKGLLTVETTFNAKLPKSYVDGLVNGHLVGWAQKVDSVNIYLADNIIAKIPCNEYRKDLVNVLEDENSGFSYKLSSKHIKKEWRKLSSITMKVEFILDNHIVEVLECPISLVQLSNELGFKLLGKKVKFAFDGVTGNSINGWCENAEVVSIFIEGSHFLTTECNVRREDLIGIVNDINCGFNIELDGKDLKTFWFKKQSLQLKAVFKGSEERILEQKTLNIAGIDLLSAVNSFIGDNVQDIADVIRSSGLWDEEYYLNQLEDHDVVHQDKVIDFILKGAKEGKNPNPHFNTYFYLANSPDLVQHGVNPFYHYIVDGEKEGRKPVPYFNPTLYLSLNPDLESWEGTLLLHLILKGLEEGRIYNEYPRPDEQNNQVEPYHSWRINNEEYAFTKILQALQSFKLRPLISIVVPVYNPEEELLIACIESVRKQSYSNWELCLADDCSPSPHVRAVLEEYAKLDGRIHVAFREQNGHISEASNSALEISQGEWIALLDHDDELHQHALFEVIDVINQSPNTTLIYSDEDKIDESGSRCEPHFKPPWNLDLLYSQNYVSHLGVYRADIVKRIGGFRKGLEGSQDYDLLLRYSREIDHQSIVHIPKVLYHWRMVEGSTALAHGEKSYTTDAGILALKDHFEALNENVIVEKGMHDNIYKVNWPCKDEFGATPLVSLVIPTYNGYEITKQAIDSIIKKSTYRNFEILLVDNNSNDPDALNYFDEIDNHEQVRVLRYPFPFNYSAINNFAVEQAKGTIIGLINNDVEVISQEWLCEMVSHAIRKDVGCVGAMLYYHNDTIQHAGAIIGIGGVAGHSHKHFKKGDCGYFSRLKIVQNVSAVTAACLLVKKDIFDEVNGLNEQDLKVAFNDIDFCLKVQDAGYRNVWTPYAELYHYESISRGAEDNPEKVARFNKEVDYMKKHWKTEAFEDICYSRNLTKEREDFSY